MGRRRGLEGGVWRRVGRRRWGGVGGGGVQGKGGRRRRGRKRKIRRSKIVLGSLNGSKVWIIDKVEY